MGTKTLTLTDGTKVDWLQDGDEVILEGWCGSADGKEVVLGFGECRGVLMPAEKK